MASYTRGWASAAEWAILALIAVAIYLPVCCGGRGRIGTAGGRSGSPRIPNQQLTEQAHAGTAHAASALALAFTGPCAGSFSFCPGACYRPFHKVLRVQGLPTHRRPTVLSPLALGAAGHAPRLRMAESNVPLARGFQEEVLHPAPGVGPQDGDVGAQLHGLAPSRAATMPRLLCQLTARLVAAAAMQRARLASGCKRLQRMVASLLAAAVLIFGGVRPSWAASVCLPIPTPSGIARVCMDIGGAAGAERAQTVQHNEAQHARVDAKDNMLSRAGFRPLSMLKEGQDNIKAAAIRRLDMVQSYQDRAADARREKAGAEEAPALKGPARRKQLIDGGVDFMAVKYGPAGSPA